MANVVTNRCKYEVLIGDANLDSADLRLLLLTSSGSVASTTNVVNDIVANELSVSGYNRQALTGETVTEDDSNNRAYLDADNVPFGALATGETIGWAVLFRHTGSDATAPVYAGYDVTDTPTNGGSVTVVWAIPAVGAVLAAT